MKIHALLQSTVDNQHHRQQFKLDLPSVPARGDKIYFHQSMGPIQFAFVDHVQYQIKRGWFGLKTEAVWVHLSPHYSEQVVEGDI